MQVFGSGYPIFIKSSQVLWYSLPDDLLYTRDGFVLETKNMVSSSQEMGKYYVKVCGKLPGWIALSWSEIDYQSEGAVTVAERRYVVLT